MTQKLPGALTVEQQFQLKVLASQVKTLDLHQAQSYVLELARQIMVQRNLTTHMLREVAGGSNAKPMG